MAGGIAFHAIDTFHGRFREKLIRFPKSAIGAEAGLVGAEGHSAFRTIGPVEGSVVVPEGVEIGFPDSGHLLVEIKSGSSSLLDELMKG